MQNLEKYKAVETLSVICRKAAIAKNSNKTISKKWGVTGKTITA